MDAKYFKYNKEDILEILIETLAKNSGFDTFSSKSDLIIDNDEIFFIGVIGELENTEIDKMDLLDVYSQIEYNGTHNVEGLSKEALLEALEKAIKTKDF